MAIQLKFASLSTEYYSKASPAEENCAAVEGLQKAIWSHVAERSMELEIDTRIAKAGTRITWEKPSWQTEKAVYSTDFPNLISHRFLSYWKPVSRTETHKFNRSQLTAENKEEQSLI